MLRCIAILAACVVSGCAGSMATTGKYSDVLSQGTPREVVIARLGPPVSSETFLGDPVDVYLVEGNLPDPGRAEQYGTYSALTFGLADLVLVPAELTRRASESRTTRKLRIRYDEAGKLRTFWVKGLEEGTEAEQSGNQKGTP